MAPEMLATIERYLAIEGPVSDVPRQLEALGRSTEFDGAREWFEKRIDALEEQGLEPAPLSFQRQLRSRTGILHGPRVSG